MDVRLEKDGPSIGSPELILSSFLSDTQARQAHWEQRLVQDPSGFREVEAEIQRHFQRGAELVTACLLACVTQRPEMDRHVQKVREESVLPLRAPERRPLRLRVGQLVVLLSVLYCPPRARSARDDQEEEQPAGLYPELAALGIRRGDSPAVQWLVARTVALSPSMELARQELQRQGLTLDKKTVRRIAEQLGLEMLAWRRRELLAWRGGKTPVGEELAGCRVAVQIDGGRIRMRENRKPPPNRKKGQRRRFHTPWREPKVLVIFAFDEQGKMQEFRQPLIEGTLLGPDHLAELAAWHLHRLGAAKAKEVVFLSDGAAWIWERLDRIIADAGLDPSRTLRVLDWCHAVEHISRALTLLNLNDHDRIKAFAPMRTMLKQSRWAEIVSELERLAAGRSQKHKVWTEIRYLRKHGEAGHLQYLTFKRRGLPFGSGAVESTIRRVINLRLKSNATYWLEENAEAIFTIRAALLSERWEAMLKAVQLSMSRDPRLIWRWSATPMNTDAPLSHRSITSQLKSNKHDAAIAV